MSKQPARPIEIFFSYSHKDEELRDELEKHLSTLKRQDVITGWHDRRIGAGTEWAGEIDTHLNTAHVILLLISSDFLASDYCYDKEMKRAMERHEAGEARVIPVILRPVDWKGAPFGKLQALPKDVKPVINWTNQDEAFLDVAKGIRAAVEELVGPAAGPPSPVGTAPLDSDKASAPLSVQESPLTDLWAAVTSGQQRRGCYAELGRILKFAILLLVPLVSGGITIIILSATGDGGLPGGRPTVAGVVGGTVVSRASDTPSPTAAPTEAQPTATAIVLPTPTVPATAVRTPAQAMSTPTPTPTRPVPMATPTPTVKLAPEPTRPPAITSYQNKIVFWSDREGGEALYVMNPDGSDQRKLHDKSVYDNALALEIISPDGRWRLEVREIENNVDIWRADVAGTQPDQRLTLDAEIDQEPAWAPIDQNRIAFVSTRMGNIDIWTQNVNEPYEERQLTDNPDYDRHPSWSPDGTQIVYWAVHGGGPRQIWVMSADGSGKRNISNNAYNDWGPIWIKHP